MNSTVIEDNTIALHQPLYKQQKYRVQTRLVFFMKMNILVLFWSQFACSWMAGADKNKAVDSTLFWRWHLHMQVSFSHCLSHVNHSYLQLFESMLHSHPFPGDREMKLAIHLVHLEKNPQTVYSEILSLSFWSCSCFLALVLLYPSEKEKKWLYLLLRKICIILNLLQLDF